MASEDEPKFLSYLLSQDIKHDCYFMVGNPSIKPPEKIGVVRKMLMAHSEVLRQELEHSEIAEKSIVHVSDIYPDTFTNLLKYVYGYDKIASLCFDDADNLLYAAEKYLVFDLKAKLSARLMKLLSVDNICSLLNNPAISRALELNSAVTDILQQETDKVLSSPTFLHLSVDAFTKILEQEPLKVPEIELWRAALKWAGNRTSSGDGVTLRHELTEVVKHIRFCTLPVEDFCKEVVPTTVLTADEVSQVCLYKGTGEKPTALTDICDRIEPRSQVPVKSDYLEAILSELFVHIDCRPMVSLEVHVKEYGIELLPLHFFANPEPCDDYQCDCTVVITDITDGGRSERQVNFSKKVRSGMFFEIPLIDKGLNIQLKPRTMNTITVNFSEPHRVWCNVSHDNFENEHFKVVFMYRHRAGRQVYYSPVQLLCYTTLTYLN